MYQFVQDIMVIVFGLVLILLLLFALKYVHEQARKVRELENELKLNDARDHTEVVTTQEEQ